VLDWFRIYPVSSIIADPFTGGALDYPDQTFYDYSLGTPAYRLDTSTLTRNGQRTWSVFAGYNKVRVKHGDPNTPATLQTTDYTFLRGMNGDIADSTGATRSVSVTPSFGPAVTDSLWWAGTTLETKVYNGLGGAVVSDTVTTPWASAVTNTGVGQSEKVGVSGTAFTHTPTARHTGEAASETHAPLSTGTTRITRTTNTFDTRGRVIKDEDLGDTGIAGDDQCTVTSYVDNTTAWLLDYPSETNTYAGTCAALPIDPATATISDTRSTYDNHAWGAAPTRGDLTKLEQAKSYTGSAATWLTTQTATYDALGRALSSSDALNRTSTVAYTPTAPAAGATVSANIGPLTQTVTTDPLGNDTTTAVHPAWGAATSVSDANSHVSTIVYDALGRTSKAWGPDRLQATYPSVPTVAYTYTISATAPTTVKTTTLTPSGGTQDSYQLYDGLLRLRQGQGPAESLSAYDAAPGTGGASVTEQLYDFAGQVTDSYGPYWITAAPSTTLFLPTNYQNIASSTGTVYDGAGRTTASITRAYGAEQWRTSYTYPGDDRLDVTPPDGGTATTTFTDARDRTTALLQYHGDTIGDPVVASGYDRTDNTYDPSGSLTGLTNTAGQQWSWVYDLLGRQISATDPDTGTTLSTYDDADQLQSTTDAAGSTLWTSYDALGRRTALNQDNASGPLLSQWVYDTLPGAKGLLASSTSFVGSVAGTPGTAYTKEVTGYDAAGRPTGSKVTLPAGVINSSGTPFTYTTAAAYNQDGSLATDTRPAAGGVPAETLHYTYTSLGRMHALIGAKQYVTDVGWDPASGLMTGLERSAVTSFLTDAYSYMPGTLRLSRTRATSSTGSGSTVADIAYSYTDAGAITKVSNTATGAAADTQCFGYDWAQRLTAAWTPADSDCSIAPSSSLLGGPAPYWSEYTYSPDGNRTSITRHAIDGAGTDVQDSYAYPAAGDPQPHAVTGISSATAPAGTGAWTATGSTSFSYTPDGQTATAGAQALTWTPLGQLATVTTSAGTQSRVYDADGNLLTVTDPTSGTTAYLGDTELHLAPGATSPTGQRIFTVNGVAVAVRNGASTLGWLDTDPHGTSELAQSLLNGAITRRYFDPFGSSRDIVPVSWMETSRGFLNAPTDPFTDYTHLGARDYNPTTGRFLSVDPLLDLTDPQSINGYAYSANNPVNQADPSGLQYAATQDDYGQFNGSHPHPPQAPTHQGKCGGPCPTPRPWEELVYVPDQDPFVIHKAVWNVVGCSSVIECGISAIPVVGKLLGKVAKAASKLAKATSKVKTAKVKTPKVKPAKAKAPARSKPVKNAGKDAAKSCQNSFTADTLVTMADGSQKSIDMVKVGDKVLASDPETGQARAEPVVQVIRHSGDHNMVLISLADGSALDSTDGHPIWDATTEQFTDAAHLQVGDKIETSTGELLAVTALTTYAADLTAYNLQIDQIHTYYAGTTPVLVHNSCGMLGENGTQVTSKTLTPGNRDYRIDVENPAPGVRPGQLHLQDRGGKYLYNFETSEFEGLPNSLARRIAKDPAVAQAIEKGKIYLGVD
jgi:RHS repeat-associated protein